MGPYLVSVNVNDLRGICCCYNWHVDPVSVEVQGNAEQLAQGEGEPITKRLRAILEPHAGPPDELVCPHLPNDHRGAGPVLHTVLKKAGVSRGGWHAARHSYGSRLGARSVPLDTARRWLGHTKGSTETLRYYSTDDTRDLEVAEDALG